MKKLFALILICISSHLSAQINTAPPKIITEIDSIVTAINSSLPKAVKHFYIDSVAPNYWTKHSVWLHDNKINKITEEAKREHNDITQREYYFNEQQIIKIQLTYINPYPHGIAPNNTVDAFYFDYNELMSEPSMLILSDTTIYLHIVELNYGYRLRETYKHLQNYNPYKNLKYDKVIAYDFDGTHEGRIVENGKLHSSTKKAQHKTLNKNQTDSLLTILSDTSTFGDNHALCFEPRLGIVFYDGKKIVADINICFECNSLYSSIYLPAEVHHKLIYGGDDYLNVQPLTGFSPIGRRQLKQLCHNLGLGLCPPMEEESGFDEN